MKKLVFLLILPLFLGLFFSGCSWFSRPQLSKVKIAPCPEVVAPPQEEAPPPPPAPVEPMEEKG